MEYKEIRWKIFQILREEKKRRSYKKEKGAHRRKGKINKKGEKSKSEGVKA